MSEGKELVEAVRKSMNAPPFDEARYVKDWTASGYWHDGRELFERAKLTRDWGQTRKSKTFKVFVDLIMSAECALKSLIISSSVSSESPEEAYTVARKKSHGLEALAEETIKRTPHLKGKVDLAILRDADAVGVQTRYGIEVLRLLSTEKTEQRFFSEGPYSRVLDDEWLRKFASEASSLSKAAFQSMKTNLHGASFRHGAEIARAEKRLTDFKKAVFR